MCDALSRNLSPKPNTILAHCLSHGRREIVSVAGIAAGTVDVYRHDGTVQPHVVLTATTAYEASAHFMNGFRVVVVFHRQENDGGHGVLPGGSRRGRA